MYTKPKKSLGQNFLVDRNIQRKILAACTPYLDGTVLEIGAGRGELTCALALQAKQVLAVELDTRLIPQLQNSCAALDNVKVLHADILKLDLSALIKGGARTSVVGNIPYYISTPIIEHLLKYKNQIGDIFITVQKEFAERAVAAPGSKAYSAFSCFVQYFTTPEIKFIIKRGAFSPMPNVDSALLHLRVRATPGVTVFDEKRFFSIIRSAFGQRRKMLRNTVSATVNPEKLEVFFCERDLPKTIRPEDLSLADFAFLSNL